MPRLVTHLHPILRILQYQSLPPPVRPDTERIPIGGTNRPQSHRVQTKISYDLAIIIMTTFIAILQIVLTLCGAASAQNTNLTVLFIYPDNSTTNMVTNNLPNSTFVDNDGLFDCSLSPIFTYNQTNYLYLNNYPYGLGLRGITAPTSVSFSTIHGNFNVTYQPGSCSSNCNITIRNNCAAPLNYQNYFDRVVVNISGYPQLLTYYVKCNQQYLSSTFEWGLVIEIVFITALLAVVALYSRAWSLGGRGINVNIWLLLAFNLIIIIGAVIGYFSEDALAVCLQVVTFLLGILGTAICINELLYLFRIKWLATIIFKIKTFEFRILQLLSLILGTAVLVGWWFSDNNIILSDIICLCVVVSCIKVLKFTSLYVATLGFAITMTLLIIVALLIYFISGASYNNLIINNFNFPFELQIPTINPVYFQKCAWLPINSIVYPGMLLSFLRRFDSSRNTTLYVILATVTFFIGGIAWMFISIASPISFPFGLVSQPCMVGLVCIFSHRRRELGVLWGGKFYDEQFGNRQDLKATMELVERESVRGSTLSPQLLDSTRRIAGQRLSSDGGDLIRSKFIKSFLQK